MRAALHSAPPVAQSPVNQRKPLVTPIEDRSEREADQIADAVVADRFPGRNSDITSYSGQGSAHIPASVGRALASSSEPLGLAQRDYFEPRFGRDLSGVFIHRDAAAGQSAAALDAQAYTFKNHIVFGAGQFAPGTMAGNRLIAHELSHTMQQQHSASPAIQRKPRRDAEEDDKDTPGIVSVTAYQGAKTGDAVLSDGTSATVDLIENKLAPGDYVTSPVGRVRNRTAQGMPGKFVYRYPLDPYTQEPLNGLSPHIEIHIRLNPTAEIRQLPSEIRNFVTSDRAREASTGEYADAAFAGQVLEQAGVTPDELILVQESQRRERESGNASTEFTGTQSGWALNYVEKRKNKKLDEASNWEALVQMAKILADAPVHLLHHGGAGSVIDPGSERAEQVQHINLFKANKIPYRGKEDLERTGARLLSEFQALIGHFEDALVADLTNLAVAALDSAEASILRMDRQYVGMWQDKKWSPHYFWREVKKIRSNEKVIAAASERDKVKSALAREQRDDEIGRAINPVGSLLEPVFSSTSYSQRTDERDKEKERQDQLFNQAVAEQSNLKVTQGFSAQDILSAAGPDEAVSKLTDFLFDGRKKITRARGRIKERKVIYAADKVIDMEKERLKGALGAQYSEISRVIDDLASYRKSQTSVWDDILKVVEFVSMFVPGPIGWGLRLGVAAINFDKKMTDIGTRSDLYGSNLSAKSVGSGEVGSAVFDAALQVVPDVPAVGNLGKGERLTLGLERTAGRGADDAANIASRTASSAEHGKPQGLAGETAGGSRGPDPPPGAQQIENAPPARPDLGVPTYGNLPGRVPTGGQRIQIIEKDGKYFELDYETGALTPAHGEYSFARMPDGSLWGSRYGHAEASMGGRVAYPGQVTFENGVRREWSGASGTYKPVGGDFAEQAGFNTPPTPIPPHPGKKVQLPMFQEPPGSVIIPPKVDKSLRTLGVTEHDMVHFANGEKVFGQLTRGNIEFTPYFIKEGDTLVAGVLSAYSKGDKAGMIKAYLTFRRSSMEMAKGMGAKTLRLEADVVVNTEGLVDSLLKQGYKLVDESSNKYALEISLR